MVNGVSLLQIMLFVDLVPPLLPTIVATKTESRQLNSRPTLVTCALCV